MTNNNRNDNECSDCETQTSDSNYKYRVQVGLFRNYNNAFNLQLQLTGLGLAAEIVRQGELFAVHVGDYCTLDEAVVLEQALRINGYDTLLVAV